MSPSLPESEIEVVVTEDDTRMLEIITRHLRRMGYAVRPAQGASEALDLLRERPAHVLLSDIRMPGMDGRSLLQLVHAKYPDLKVILMTAFGSVDDAVQAMQEGAYSYVTKPFKVEEIAVVLQDATRELALGAAPSPGTDTPGPMSRLMGSSRRMEEVRRQIQDAGLVQSPVLITGRSGTGKEVAARSIHYGGSRSGGPFVPVNCAAIPETLFESEMFGFARGAFTGATTAKSGLIAQSHGGTIFLDEAGEIPLKEQAKLLRVLEERKVRRLGETDATPVDVRIVCATNRSLEAMVKKGEFREDLFYRLNVLRIHMPELSERPEDIPPLVDKFLVELAEENQIRMPGYEDGFLEELQARSWPGNVRELRNHLEVALVRSAGRRLTPGDLPDASPSRESRPDSTGSGSPGGAAGGLPSLAEVEKEHIHQVLKACRWNRSAAAKVLGIDRRTLFSKIQRYGLVG